jgi:hypothetical protein
MNDILAETCRRRDQDKRGRVKAVRFCVMFVVYWCEREVYNLGSIVIAGVLNIN